MILDKISIIRANWRNIKWLNDHAQFYNLDIFAGKEINYITNLEKSIASDLKLLKNEEYIFCRLSLKMNTPSQTNIILLKKFVNKILS